jgi:hypothetical protein
MLLKERKRGWEDEKEDVNSYWMTFSNQKTLQIERGRTI